MLKWNLAHRNRAKFRLNYVATLLFKIALRPRYLPLDFFNIAFISINYSALNFAKLAKIVTLNLAINNISLQSRANTSLKSRAKIATFR